MIRKPLHLLAPGPATRLAPAVWTIALGATLAGTMLAGWIGAPGDGSARSVTLPGTTLAMVIAGGRPRLVVTSLQTDGAGSAAGLRVGDRIEAVDGVRTDSLGALAGPLARAPRAGLVLHVGRDRRVLDIRVPTGEDAS